MHKSRPEAKPGFSISCFEIPDSFVNDKLVIKQYFQKYGKVVRIFLRPKRKMCIVEFNTEDSAENAIQEGGIYEGQHFRIGWTKQKKAEITKIVKKSEKKREWGEDMEVLAELEAMQSINVDAYTPLSKNMLDKKKDSALSSSKLLIKKQRLKKVVEKPPKTVQRKKNEKKVIAEPREILPVINSEQALELLKLITRRAETSEEKYRVLDARDKLVRMRMVRQSNINKVSKTVGTCPDMCPEKERLMRVAQHQIALYEQAGEGRGSGMNHSIAVKQYSRSSADQETPLAHELRPVQILEMTMGYLLHRIVDLCDLPDVNLAEWYHFLWDRTRGIRKDITQQELCCQGSVRLLEQCARFHIHCSARLVAEDVSVFDQKINTENLTKCLQTLKYMYHDLAIQGEKCPNEAEFRGYIVLMNLNDGNFMWELQQLSREIQESPQVKFALKVYSALDKNNYVRFFKYVHSTTYLNACILLRYFYQVRLHALRRILKSYSPRQPFTTYPITELTNILAFESPANTIEFLEHYGLSVNEEGSLVLLDRKAFSQPDMPFQNERAVNVIESKRNYSVGEVICGTALPPRDFIKIVPHDSFDSDGYLKSSEIPPEWRSKCSDLSFEEDTSASAVDTSMETSGNQVRKQEEEPSKPTFTFCLPKTEAQNITFQVPVAQTTFSFTKPDIVPSPFTAQAKRPDNNPFESSAKPNFLDNVKNMDTTDGAAENPFFNTFFGPKESVKSAKEVKNTDVIFSFETPTVQNMLFQPVIANRPVETFGDFKFTPANNIPAQIEKNEMEVKVTLTDFEVPKKNDSNVLPPISYPINESPPVKVVETPKFTLSAKIAPIIPDVVQKPVQPTEVVEPEIKAVRIPKVTVDTTNQLKEQKKKDEILLKDVKMLLGDVLDRVDTEIERDQKLRNISTKIKKRRLTQYVKKWQNNIWLAKRRRNLFYDNPVWISTKSLNQEAKELLISSQNLTINDKKRYLGGTIQTDKIIPTQLRTVSKLDVAQTVWKILFEKISNTEHPNLNVFWKVGFSFIRNNSYASQTWEKLVYSVLNVSKKEEKIIESQPIENGGNFTYCLEKLNSKNDLNGVFYIVDFTELTKFSVNFMKLMTSVKNVVPVLIIILNSPILDKDAIIKNLKINFIKSISNYEIVFVQKSITLPIITASLQWLAHNLEPFPNLELDSLSSLLNKCAGDEFWYRIDTNSKINNRLKIILHDPNIAIKLYNKALDLFLEKVLNTDLNCRDFPSEFKKYLDTNFIKLPCTFEYFPENWRTISENVKTVIKSMYLPHYEENWPQNALKDIVTSLENYCVQHLNSYKTFNNIVRYLSGFINFEEANHKNIPYLFMWSDIIRIIVHDKIDSLGKEGSLLVVYNREDIKDLREIPWWYRTEEISLELKSVEGRHINNSDEESSEESDDDIIEIDVNDTINQVTRMIENEENQIDEDMKKDYSELTTMIDDLEMSLDIQQQIMNKFKELANSALNDDFFNDSVTEE